MGFRVDLSMTNNISGVAADILGHLQRGVARASERLLALSAEQVPHDLGTLQASGAVTVETDGADVVGSVSYDTPYAARLHEHPEFNFQGGRKGKYLEDPAVENRQELGDIIRREVRGA